MRMPSTGSIALPVHFANALQLLDGRPAEECSAWCSAAGDALRAGVNERALAAAAVRLQLPLDDVRLASRALMFLLCDAARLRLSTDDFASALGDCGLRNPDLIDSLVETYKQVGSHLTDAGERIVPQPNPYYDNVKWRLDVEVGRRAIKDVCEPVGTLELTTKSTCNRELTEHRLQVDAATAAHMQRELERAVQCVKGRNYGRVANAARFAAKP